MQMTYKQMAQALKNAGFSGIQIPIMIAIGMAESGGDTANVGDNGQSYGIWQIYQPVWGNQFGQNCAVDLQCAAKAAWTISNHGTNFKPWTVYRAAVEPQTLDPSLRANKFTNYLPDVLTYFGLSPSLDWAASLQGVISGTLDTVSNTVNGVIASWHGDTTGGVIPVISLPSLPDWAKDVLKNVSVFGFSIGDAEAIAKCGIPGATRDESWIQCVGGSIVSGATGGLLDADTIKRALIAGTVLAIGGILIVVGAYGMVNQTSIGKAATDAGKKAVKDTATLAVAMA